MSTPHMRQRKIPQCVPRLSPLRLHSVLVVVALKVENTIIIQDPQPAQAYSSDRTPRRRTRREHQVHTPAGSSSSGSGSIARPTPPMAPGIIPSSATAPLVTRLLSSSAGSKGVATGSSAAASAVGSHVPPHRGGSGGNPIATGGAALGMMDSIIDVSGDDRFEHGPSEFPPKLYPGGEKVKSPWWPTRKTEKLYGSRLDQVRKNSTFCFFPTPPLSLMSLTHRIPVYNPTFTLLSPFYYSHVLPPTTNPRLLFLP